MLIVAMKLLPSLGHADVTGLKADNIDRSMAWASRILTKTQSMLYLEPGRHLQTIP
jgi:crotonobetainyl-CoA:carnitine CoA-transferase CaiB-like acyl-CoA transferase